MNAIDMLAKIRISAQVVSTSSEAVTIAVTANQFEKLTKVLQSMPTIASVTENRLVCAVTFDALKKAIDAGRTAGNVVREIEYNVQRLTVYNVRDAQGAVNNVESLTWYDENYGWVRINDMHFDVSQSSAGTLLNNAPNPSRKLVYIRAYVERDGARKHVLLHSGSVSGLIKRLVNYTWKIVDESEDDALTEIDDEDDDDETVEE